MARNPANFLPINTDPLGDYESKLHNVVGGDPNFFRYGRFGLLTDNSRLRQRIEGGASPAPSNAYVGGGSSSYSFGGGETSTQPGRRNWATLQRNLDRVAQGAWGMVNWRTEKKRNAQAREARKWQDTMDTYRKSFDPDFYLPGVYDQAFDQYQTTIANQRTQAYQNSYGQPDVYGNAYQDMVNRAGLAKSTSLAGAPLKASQNVTAGIFAANNPVPVPGSASPIGGRKKAPVNLLTSPGTAPAATPPPLPAAPAPKSRTQARKGAAKSAAPQKGSASKPKPTKKP